MGRKFGSREAYVAHRKKLADQQARHERYMMERDAEEELAKEIIRVSMKRALQFLNGQAFIELQHLGNGNTQIRLLAEKSAEEQAES